MIPDTLHRPLSATLLAAALLALLPSASPREGRASSADIDPSAPQSADQLSPILGAALTILTDGSAPWEDRPLLVPGLGMLPGKPGQADPGDDTGPADRVVRSWDSLFYQVAVSLREAVAEDVTVEVSLSGPAVWEPARVMALGQSRCAGGATLSDDGQHLRCVIGRLEAPPAVTLALDLSARVDRAALQGQVISASASVRSPGVETERERARCPIRVADGCDAKAPDVSVSAAPAVELRKYLLGVAPLAVEGVAGRQLTWRLDAVQGADGDVRGSSSPVGAPWSLPDWWRVSGRDGREIASSVRLLGCAPWAEGTEWSCAQPGGIGQPVAVTITRLGEPAKREVGVGATSPKLVGSLRLTLWLPEDELQASGWDVDVLNCFGTQVAAPDQPVWAPRDAAGQPNLGGMPEPWADNCAAALLPVPRPGRDRPPRRPLPPGDPDPGRPPPARPTPEALVSKRYTPLQTGDMVTAGTEFAAEVAVRVLKDEGLEGVAACDKWDNSTQSLRDGGEAGLRVWWRQDGGPPEVMDPAGVVVEYARGPWGRERPAGRSAGRGWYVQATTPCDDAAALAPSGWVPAEAVDFGNAGTRVLDAQAVNMVRVRFRDPLPPGLEAWIEVLLRGERVPGGTWLMNYGAAAWGNGSRPWRVQPCDAAVGTGSSRACPVPAQGSRRKPGPLGDMLVQASVPLWLTKQNEPPVPGGSPIINAGQTAGFRLEASTIPRPEDPPPPAYPPGAFAHAVVITDTLPAGLTYEPGSARIASEDIDGDGLLDEGEDRNGNGRIDTDVGFEPALGPGPADRETNLVWALGDLPYQHRAPSISFLARVSRLVPAGSSLVNWAGAAATGEPLPACMQPGRQRGDLPLIEPRPRRGGPAPLGLAQTQAPISATVRCTWAQVLVANTAMAQIEKVAVAPWVRPGESMRFRLSLANLSYRPIEWFDAVDLLPQPDEARQPQTRLMGGVQDVRVANLSGGKPLDLWASATAPEALDTAGGGLRDGTVDPVQAWGSEGAGLGGPDWPCLLTDVGSFRCRAIPARSAITALRLWGPDPDRRRSGAWAESFLPAGGPPQSFDLTLSVPGSQPGDLAHNAWGGRFQGLPLPVFDAAVVRVPPLPTATLTPTLTATASSTVTAGPANATAPPSRRPTVTETASPPASATLVPRSPAPIYLPILGRFNCTPRPVDAVLVIDLSTSMLRPAGDGGSKQAAVLRAARAFVQSLAPEATGGRVAVAAFNDQAWLVQALSGDSSRLFAALDSLPERTAEGTRLDLGLRVGAAALADVQPERLRAMVFLTDGLPNRVPTPTGGGAQEDTVLAVAGEVHARGIVIHTIGYGREDAPALVDRISPELLRAIAGAEGGYHETDDAGTLAQVFRAIATALGCAEGPGWP